MEQNIENKIYRKYQVAREMWESAISPIDKDRWFTRMDGCAAKINTDDYDNLTLPKQVDAQIIVHYKSTPQTETLRESLNSTHSSDNNFNSICSSTRSL